MYQVVSPLFPRSCFRELADIIGTHLEASVAAGDHGVSGVILTGPVGTGKSRFAEYLVRTKAVNHVRRMDLALFTNDSLRSILDRSYHNIDVTEPTVLFLDDVDEYLGHCLDKVGAMRELTCVFKRGDLLHPVVIVLCGRDLSTVATALSTRAVHSFVFSELGSQEIADYLTYHNKKLEGTKYHQEIGDKQLLPGALSSNFNNLRRLLMEAKHDVTKVVDLLPHPFQPPRRRSASPVMREHDSNGGEGRESVPIGVVSFSLPLRSCQQSPTPSTESEHDSDDSSTFSTESEHDSDCSDSEDEEKIQSIPVYLKITDTVPTAMFSPWGTKDENMVGANVEWEENYVKKCESTPFEDKDIVRERVRTFLDDIEQAPHKEQKGRLLVEMLEYYASDGYKLLVRAPKMLDVFRAKIEEIRNELWLPALLSPEAKKFIFAVTGVKC